MEGLTGYCYSCWPLLDAWRRCCRRDQQLELTAFITGAFVWAMNKDKKVQECDARKAV